MPWADEDDVPSINPLHKIMTTYPRFVDRLWVVLRSLFRPLSLLCFFSHSAPNVRRIGKVTIDETPSTGRSFTLGSAAGRDDITGWVEMISEFAERKDHEKGLKVAEMPQETGTRQSYFSLSICSTRTRWSSKNPMMMGFDYSFYIFYNIATEFAIIRLSTKDESVKKRLAHTSLAPRFDVSVREVEYMTLFQYAKLIEICMFKVSKMNVFFKLVIRIVFGITIVNLKSVCLSFVRSVLDYCSLVHYMDQ